MTRYSYFDDFTPDQRDMVRLKMIEKGLTWDEVMKRYGHPKDWEEDNRQFNMFEELR